MERDRQPSIGYGNGSNNRRENPHRNDNGGSHGRHGRRVDFHVDEEKSTSHDPDYDDFLAWKEHSRSLRRGRANDDGGGDQNSYHRPRCDQIFHS